MRTHCRLVLLHLMEEHWIFVNNTNIGYFYIKVFTILWRLAYNRGRMGEEEREVCGRWGGGRKGVCVAVPTHASYRAS